MTESTYINVTLTGKVFLGVSP